MTERVQQSWGKALAREKVAPPAKSWVAVKFILNSSGEVARVVSVENHSTDKAARICVGAIVDDGRYGKWTKEMIADLGNEQEFTLRFLHQ